MHTNIDLIMTLTGCMAAALVLGYVTQRLGLSPIVGYLLAGVVVGPNTRGYEADRHLAEQLGEVGVILLMFGVGLQFHIKELLAVRRIAIPGAIFQSFAATILGAVMGWGFGWGWSAGLVYGMAISVASTVVLIRVLADHNDLHTPSGHVAVGWLVVEDLFTVVLLVLLPALFGGESAGAGGLPLALLLTALKIGLLVAATFVVGGRVIPWLLGRVAQTRSRELFTLTVLVVALGIAVVSAKLFGVSMALGAFLAGMLVGRSDFSLRAATDALPMRDAFAVLFFVATGMLFDPRFLFERPGLVAATLGIVILGKPLAAFAIVLVLRYPIRIALAVATALAQIGEFSFMLATLGRSLDVLPEEATNALVAAAIVSISINPLLYRLVDPVEAWIARRPKLSRWLGRHAASTPISADPERPASHRAVIVGYGPVGQTLSRLLRENDVEPTIIEMNKQTVHRLNQEGIPAVYGDAGHLDTLKAAGVDRAAGLLLSASGLRNAEEIIRLARELNPKIRISVRCTYLRDIAALRKVGAHGIFSGEGEVALALTESVLRDLGALPEQIDRQRERVRADLFAETNFPPADASAASKH
ncbi:cation:proton antiporter [Schlesneria paludicola]|uniref:cation:proton antiporter n=1 Tax=Schlesneria paludicola TaxID=360056 RepID=UPI00029A94B6|nr:cation:proton antiporter [Schlesneria paludicola]